MRRSRVSGSVPALVERARAGDARAVARLISLVEDESPHLREVMAGLRRTPGTRRSSASPARPASASRPRRRRW